MPTLSTDSSNLTPHVRAYRFGTLAIHTGSEHDPSTGAVIPPINLSTTFAQSSSDQPVGRYKYSRTANPNRDSLESVIAALENAKHAITFSSGIAAIGSVLQTLTPGSHVISMANVYGGTHRYFTKVAAAHHIEVSFASDLTVQLEEMIIPGKTKIVWVETPSNPTLDLVNINVLASITRKHGILLVVDNTFMSPYIQNPLDLGADIVVHSVTKYINGHSDVLMGVVAINSDELKEKISFIQFAAGSVPSPFDCWLAQRGLKTLHLRAREATKNASIIALTLEQSKHVISVRYPGLNSHPQRHLAIKQHKAGMGGGMLSFRIRGGQKAANSFCRYTKLFTLAESLGGIESLCEVPSMMTHAGLSKAEREQSGVFDDLVRISCGVEDSEDLKDDVLQALTKSVNESTFSDNP